MQPPRIRIVKVYTHIIASDNSTSKKTAIVIYLYRSIIIFILVKIKPRNRVLTDIITEAKQQPKGWTAAFGHDDEHGSNDYYIFNPQIGIYLLKEYQKNPYEIKGVGAKITRHIDDDILQTLRKTPINFGIIQGNIYKIMRNIESGIHPQKIFEAALHGKDLGINIPLKGHASTSPEAYTQLKNILSSKQKKLNTTLEKMITDDGIYNAYH
jgi:hypothetical protein